MTTSNVRILFELGFVPKKSLFLLLDYISRPLSTTLYCHVEVLSPAECRVKPTELCSLPSEVQLSNELFYDPLCWLYPAATNNHYDLVKAGGESLLNIARESSHTLTSG